MHPTLIKQYGSKNNSESSKTYADTDIMHGVLLSPVSVVLLFLMWKEISAIQIHAYNKNMRIGKQEK